MSQLADRPFLKMNGIGNEIVVLDLRGTSIDVSPAEARAISRGRMLDYDQLMVIHDPRRPDTQARIDIFNVDGSRSAACGNGTRCVAWAMLNGGKDRNDRGGELTLESDAGLLAVRRDSEWRFTVDMGSPRLGWQEIPLRDAVEDTSHVTLPAPPPGTPAGGVFSAVSMGNPHAVFFVEAIEQHDLAKIGPLLEHHPMFPQRANISLAHVTGLDHIDLKVWERGTGITRACGSAACATLVAAVRNALSEREARVSLPGGDLVIHWRESDSHVLMTGDVELEFQDRFDPALFAGIPA